MSDTIVERPVADLASLQRELEELAARARSDGITAGARPEVQEAGWGK